MLDDDEGGPGINGAGFEEFLQCIESAGGSAQADDLSGKAAAIGHGADRVIAAVIVHRNDSLNTFL